METEAGSFVLKLYPGAAADKFAELAEGDSFAAAPFATLAENMFVQCPALSAETFGGEQNELACIYGAVGFAMDGGALLAALVLAARRPSRGHADPLGRLPPYLAWPPIRCRWGDLHWIAPGEKNLGFLAWEPIQCGGSRGLGPALMSAKRREWA